MNWQDIVREGPQPLGDRPKRLRVLPIHGGNPGPLVVMLGRNAEPGIPDIYLSTYLCYLNNISIIRFVLMRRF